MSKQPLRIIFMGTPDFAAATLKALIDGPDEVVAVVTQPDRAKGRGKKLTPPPTKVLAESARYPGAPTDENQDRGIPQRTAHLSAGFDRRCRLRQNPAKITAGTRPFRLYQCPWITPAANIAEQHRSNGR